MINTITNALANVTIDQLLTALIAVVLIYFVITITKKALRIVLSVLSVLSFLHTLFPSLYSTIITQFGGFLSQVGEFIMELVKNLF